MSVALDKYVGQVYVHTGTTGTGKTFALKHGVAEAIRKGIPHMVLDRMFEWNEIPQSWEKFTRGATTVDQAARYMRKGALLVILRPDDYDPIPLADRMARWAVEWEGPAGVAIPEAHHVLPVEKRRPPVWIDKMLTGRRHHETILWLDTQRPARMNTTAIELATVTRIFATPGRRDRQTLYELAGKELVSSIEEINRRYAITVREQQPSEGWHVAMDISRMPPYEIVRIGDA